MSEQGNGAITPQGAVDQIKAQLEQLYNELSSNPEAAGALVAVWDRVAVLAAANEHNEALIASLAASLEEMRNQRDYALYDREIWQLRGELTGIASVITGIADGLGLGRDELYTLYDYMSGEIAAGVDPAREAALRDAIRALVNNISADEGVNDL